MSNTLKLVIKDINDCLYHIQSWLYSATLDLKKAFDDCLHQIQSGLYSATLDLEKAFENVLQKSNPLFPRLE